VADHVITGEAAWNSAVFARAAARRGCGDEGDRGSASAVRRLTLPYDLYDDRTLPTA